MARIKGKNTKPELVMRRALHARGLRYLLHDRRLPGRPDLVLPKYRAAIFIHGCFWHGHDCELFRLPGTRAEFWNEKIGGNRLRDEKVLAAIHQLGWRTLVIWECSMRGKKKLVLDDTVDAIVDWVRSGEPSTIIRGG